MQPFKQLLATIGVGAAKIDTQLETLEVQVGHSLQGQFVVTGGTVDQQIDDIYISIKAKYKKQGLDSAYYTNGTVGHFKVCDSFTIHAGETKHIPFVIQLPLHTPVTDGYSVLWLKTALDIHHAVHQEDEDYLIVTPLPLMQTILNTLSEVGFEKIEVGCEDGTLEGMLPVDSGFYQVFRFKPISEKFVDIIDHLNIVFNVQSEDKVDVIVEIHKKSDGLLNTVKEELGLDSKKVTLYVTSSQTQSLSQDLINHLTTTI